MDIQPPPGRNPCIPSAPHPSRRPVSSYYSHTSYHSHTSHLYTQSPDVPVLFEENGVRVRRLAYDPGKTQTPHHHDFTSVTLVLRGDCVEKSEHDSYLSQSCMVLIKPGYVEHANIFGMRGSVSLQISFSPHTFPNFPVRDACRHLEGGLSAARMLGLLRVTTSLAFSTHQLAPVILEFMARHPLVELELLPTDRVVDMVEEGVDIAIRIGRLADTSFMARKIGEDKRLICAAPSYLARHGTPQRPEDLAQHNCLVSRDRSQLNRWPFKRDGQVFEIEVGGRVAVTEGEIQMQLALQGIGIVRLTRLTLAQAIRDGTLVPLLGDFAAYDDAVPIHAVYPHRRHLAPKVPAFVNFLIEKFTPPPWEI